MDMFEFRGEGALSLAVLEREKANRFGKMGKRKCEKKMLD